MKNIETKPCRNIRHVPHEYKDQYVAHLVWDELEFDVKYRITKSAQLAGIKGKDAKPFQFTESDIDWLTRQIDTAINNVRSKVSWACKYTSRYASDEIKEHPKCYDLIFEFSPEDGWQGNPNSLMNYIHNYIVKFCEADWLRLSSVQAYATSIQIADEELQNVFNEVNRCLITPPKFVL